MREVDSPGKGSPCLLGVILCHQCLSSASSLGSSIWQSQPQTTAAHMSCLKDERMLFAAVSALFKRLFLCSLDKATAEVRERLQAEQGLGKEVLCLAASNSVPDTSKKLK